VLTKWGKAGGTPPWSPPYTMLETSLEPPHAGYNIDELPIGEAKALFFDSQEDLWQACIESTYEESSEDSGEDDYIDEENNWALEEMLLPPEMLYSVHSLRSPKRRRHINEGGDV
jgi:hypothetical protein